MGLAEDQVKKFIQSNYRMFQDVRLDQLLIDLPCLTSADRQEIRCHMDRQGNILSVSEFFDHLWGRSGWVPQLIAALENNTCERLAEIIQRVYQDALPPSQRASSARSPPPVAQCYQSSVSVPVGSGAPSFDSPPLSPPCNQPGPTRNTVPTGVNALAPAPSESLQDVKDYRSPVQETKSPSLSSETASEAKAGGNDIKPKSSTPGQRNRNAAESDANVAAQHENPTNVQAASPRSPVQHQTPPREVSEKEVRSSTPVPSSSDAGDSVRNWDSFQPRPVCVKNGYFGNVSRSVDGGLSPAPELAVSSAPTAPGSQPEEDSYVSYDSSPLTRGGQDGAQADEQKIPPSWGYPQEDLFDNPANQPFLPWQVDEEQKGAQGQQDSAGNVNAAPLLREKGPFVPEPSQTASSLGQSPSKSSQLPQRSLSKEHFGQIPSTDPAVQFWPPPSGFSGFSSTDVIPPNSPAAPSSAVYDAYPGDLNPPVQERNLRGTAPWTTPEKMMGAVPPRANVARPSYAADIPANASENTKSASGPSRGTRVFDSNHEEDDISLEKPSVLLSTGGPLDQYPSHRSAAYSGTSARLRFSGGPSDGSDPLMLSDSTQGSRSEDPERNTSVETDRASLRCRNDHLPEEGSVRIHTVRVVEPPSVELTGAPEISRPALGNASQPPGDFSDSAAGDQPTGKGSSGSVRSDGQRNSGRNERVADAASWRVSDSRLLAVGFALTSLAAVAFVLYKKLKK